MIPISNLFHMLAYAYSGLCRGAYRHLNADSFEGADDLYAAILGAGLRRLQRQGLGKCYVPRIEALALAKGRVDMGASMAPRLRQRRMLVCEYDRLTADAPANRVYKATALALAHCDRVKKTNRTVLSRLAAAMPTVADIPLTAVCWDSVRPARNRAEDNLLLAVCRLAAGKLLPVGPRQNGLHAAEFADCAPLCRLYERFVRNFYRRHRPLYGAKSTVIDWQAEGDTDCLPDMITDVTLRKDGRTVVLDTKFYSHALSRRYGGKAKYHAANLYQMYAYIKNSPQEFGSVTGVLLYAKSDEDAAPDGDMLLSGNPVLVRTVDLSADFPQIERRLLQIADDCLAER